MLWETHDEKGQGLTPNIRKDSKDNTENENPTEDLKRIGFLEEDNLRLKGQVRALAGRVTELEKELALRDSIPSPSPFNAVLNAKPTITASNPLGDKIYSVPANSKLLCRKTITTNGPLSEGAALDSPTKESTMSKSTSLSLNTSLPPYATNESAGNNMNSVISSFKPIAASSSNTMNTIMGTRVSVTSSSATTHATESSTNTGSVSPLTEVTEGFIRRGAQRVTQPVNTLSNISGNVSMCTSEQEHNTFSNNDLHSETASEDSGVLVPVDRVFSTSSLGTKDGSVGAEMEMSGLNLISSFDSVSKQTLTPSQHSIIPVSPSANTAAVSVPHVQATLAAVQSVAAEKSVSKSVESVESASKTTDLAALDGDEEDDDGWS